MREESEKRLENGTHLSLDPGERPGECPEQNEGGKEGGPCGEGSMRIDVFLEGVEISRKTLRRRRYFGREKGVLTLLKYRQDRRLPKIQK